ncbi:MAG: serine/threonine protein kinase [Chitinophagaceae bacterium]
MDNSQHFFYRADDRSYYSIIKKEVRKMTEAAGFSATKLGELDIVVAEMTSNLNKHAKGGEIFFRVAGPADRVFAEVICVDEGPGFSESGAMIKDGYSSMGTLGHGLGSISRLSDEFDMYSLKGWGTILFSRIYAQRPSKTRQQAGFWGLNVPLNGEIYSGDGYCFEETKEGFKILMADGLGHGQEAHLAVTTACTAFAQCTETSPAETIRALHHAVRKTRGLVGIVVFFNRHTKTWLIAGVGNYALRWISGNTYKNHASYNGIIGHSIPNTINDSIVRQEDFSHFIACSDGLKSKWELSKFPMIGRHHSMVQATALLKEFSRKTDDASVVICKTA